MGDVDLRNGLEQLGAEMRRAADADGGIVECARLLPRERDQLLKIACGQRCAHDQDLIAHRQHRDRREVALPVVGYALVEARRDRQRAVGCEVERVAVGVRARRELGSDQAASACAVVDHDLLSPDGGELVAEQASQQVAAAASGVRNDEADRAGWELLCGTRHRRECGDRHGGKQRQRTYRIGSHGWVSEPENALMRVLPSLALPLR
jgi:hypothetical protein